MRKDFSPTFPVRYFGKVVSVAFICALLAVALPSGAARADGPTPVLDQSFTEPGGTSAAINDCCRYTAQVFTAGMTGALTHVSVDIVGRHDFSLRVAIHGATGGMPNGTILAERYVLDDHSVPQSSAPLTLMIDMGTVYVQDGQQYAIVVDYDGSGSPGHAEGDWGGALGNAYTGGAAYATNDNTFETWDFAGDPGLDLHFKTYVVPNVPVSDLSITYTGGARKSKACETFEENFSIHNAGPDPADHIFLGLGITDHFDWVSTVAEDGSTAPWHLDVGQDLQVKVLIKTTAFVPGETRNAWFYGAAVMNAWPEIAIDPNPDNDVYEGAIRMISRPKLSCP